MKHKQENPKNPVTQTKPQPVSLMAVQEKLGLFGAPVPQEAQDTTKILDKKPLGYI